MYSRPHLETLHRRIDEPRRFMQVLFGPRQVGKTTLVQQLMDRITHPTHYASADAPAIEDTAWIEQQWETARLKLAGGRENIPVLLILDEIHKIPDWSSAVKALWDADTYHKRDMRVILLGSSPLLVQKGIAETLAGRFEMIRVPHWSFREIRDAFGWDLDRFLHFGGYPGAASLIEDEDRWRQYLRDSIIETTISRDVLLLTQINKPVMLRRLYDLGCAYSGQVMSYTKMLGQLHDAGNTTTLAHYLNLLNSAGFLAGLEKYSGRIVRKRASSPKLQVWNTALMTASTAKTFSESISDREYRWRLVESAVGAHLINEAMIHDCEIHYWRENNREVDFVIRSNESITAIEVKSGRVRESGISGMKTFLSRYPESRAILVSDDALPLNDFLLLSLPELLDR